MGRPPKIDHLEEIRALAKHSRITDKQMRFLEEYEKTLSINRAAKNAGLRPDNVMIAVKKDTPFGKAFRKLVENIDKDPRFNKAGAISMLMDLRERAIEQGKLDLELKIIQEINKMINGNIAVAKKEVTKRNFNVNAVIDLTKPKKEIEAQDVEYEDVDNE